MTSVLIILLIGTLIAIVLIQKKTNLPGNPKQSTLPTLGIFYGS
jgi:hypothetical protein